MFRKCAWEYQARDSGLFPGELKQECLKCLMNVKVEIQLESQHLL